MTMERRGAHRRPRDLTTPDPEGGEKRPVEAPEPSDHDHDEGEDDDPGVEEVVHALERGREPARDPGEERADGEDRGEDVRLVDAEEGDHPRGRRWRRAE